MLTITHLQKSFGAHRVLQGLNLTIQSGDLTAIIGPNGCGKSTLFNLLTGELRPDAGEILFFDKKISGLKPRKIAQQGILRKFQIPGIYPAMTVLEHLQLAFIVQKRPFSQEKITEILVDMNLETIAKSRAGVLSTGQKQWLELAMLVLLEPRLLLLDEPIAGMTAAEAEKTRHILHHLNQRGLTIVTIEHNIDFVRRLTDDIAVIMSGKVIKRADYDSIAADAQIKADYLGTLYA